MHNMHPPLTTILTTILNNATTITTLGAILTSITTINEYYDDKSDVQVDTELKAD